MAEAQKNNQEEVQKIKEFAAQNRSEIINQSKRTVDSFNALATQIKSELSFLGAAAYSGTATGSSASDEAVCKSQRDHHPQAERQTY